MTKIERNKKRIKVNTHTKLRLVREISIDLIAMIEAYQRIYPNLTTLLKEKGAHHHLENLSPLEAYQEQSTNNISEQEVLLRLYSLESCLKYLHDALREFQSIES